ncbi:MAG: hypothetical protein HYV35_12950 [Lentisphaerae bacterium]|nr:hypothetical protein [Lentisphaerota bacterium]
MKKNQANAGLKEDRGKAQWRHFLFGLALVIYALATFNTMLAHEPWRDEAYAWLIARDADLVEFFRLRAYDWSPGLWYLILMPFAKLAFPYLTMSIIHWLLAVAVVAFILWRSPFSPLTKLLLVFSYYLFWEYVISVRVYAVSILLLVILAQLYPERFKRPIAYAALIALLFSANMHVSGMAAALSAAYVLEAVRLRYFSRPIILGGILMGLGALALFLQVGIQPADCVRGETQGWSFNASRIYQALVGAFFVGVGPVNLLVPAGIVMFALIFWGLATRPMPCLIFLGHTAFLLYVFAKTGGGVRHHGLLLIGTMFCLWIAGSPSRPGSGFPRAGPEASWRWLESLARKLPDNEARWRAAAAALNFVLLVSLPAGVMMHNLEHKHDYSGGKAMAGFITANHLEQYPIAAHRDAAQISLLPYLPGKQLWYATIGAYGTYYRQNQQRYQAFFAMTYADALQKIEQAFPAGSPLLILLDAPLPPGHEQKYRLIHKVDSTVFGSDERFYLYARF